MKSLVSKAKKGDKNALSLLIENHKDFAYNLALNFLKNTDEAKDVTQQSFLIVLENLSKFRQEAKFSTWLYKIIYHESLKIRKLKTGKENVMIRNDEAYMDDGQIEKDEMNEQLYRSVDMLREHEKAVIMLHYLSEKSINEISKITGFTISNIKVLLHRGRLNLKKQLTNENAVR